MVVYRDNNTPEIGDIVKLSTNKKFYKNYKDTCGFSDGIGTVIGITGSQVILKEKNRKFPWNFDVLELVSRKKNEKGKSVPLEDEIF